MTSPNHFSFQYEGLSPSKPPFFNGSDFNYWRSRMDRYLRSLDFDLWYIITKGPFVFRKKVGDKFVDKEIDEYDVNDKIAFQRTIELCIF